MLPFGVTIPATVPQGSEIPEGLMNNPVYITRLKSNEIFSPSNKIHREVGQIKDLSAPMYQAYGWERLCFLVCTFTCSMEQIPS